MKELIDRLVENLGDREELSDEEIYDQIDRIILGEALNTPMPLAKMEALRRNMFASVRGFDVLQELLEDSSITEIMVNGYRKIYIERDGRIIKTDKMFTSKERFEDVIQQMVSLANRRVNEASPIVDSRLPDGSRVNVVLAPIAINGPIVTIRKFAKKPITMDKLIEWGSVSREVAEFLRDLVVAGYNIFVSGGTGSGKTTFLNILSEFIPPEERVITIEDSAELQLTHIDNIVSLEARNNNAEGENGITIRDLIKTALRARPDRIIVGEVRGEEAFDLLQAFNTGHDGSLSTGHANSPKDMISRLETMVLMGVDMPVAAIRSQIGAAIDIIVHLGRLRDRTRRVVSVTEVDGYGNGEVKYHEIFRFKEEGEDAFGRIIGCFEGDSGSLLNRTKLINAGILKGDTA
ncbi:MAG: CpaF family protein [Lachnospiraceae bacterium]|nr:CpaF family protein [Lachnospiraceae bacterium]